jgi:hypothetical protein
MTEATSAVSVAAAHRMRWRGLAGVDPLDAHLRKSGLMWQLGRSADSSQASIAASSSISA